METYQIQALFVCLIHDLQCLLQMHMGGVIDPAGIPAEAQKDRIDQAARVNHNIRLFQQGLAPQRDQIGSSRSRAYKMYHGSSLLFLL